LLHAVAAGKITPPRQAGPLTALLMRLLRTEPEERPTVLAAKEALTAIAAGRPVPPGLLSGNYDGPTVATRVKPPMQMPPPPMPMQKPGHQATRLDANPLAEPRRTPPGGFGPMGPAGPPPGPPMGPIDREARPPEPKQGKDVRKIVLTVLAIAGAALVGVLVASLFTSSTPTNASTNTTTPKPPNVTVTETLTTPKTTPTTTKTTPPSSSSSTVTTTPTSPSEDEFDGADDFVSQYYDQLPQNTEAAWAMLTPKAQSKSRGKDNFVKFYAEMTDVRITDTKQEGNIVTGNVRFTRKNGENSTERYKFTIIKQGDSFLIDDFNQTNEG
jgi:hypothetical protein